MSIHNICFCQAIRKKRNQYFSVEKKRTLSVAMFPMIISSNYGFEIAQIFE